MKKCGSTFILLVAYYISISQNTIGLPQIINYTNNDFHAGEQTWDIKQDKWGRMYFANNEGLITYDGSYWKLYPQPNKTILRSIEIDNNRIYAGGQDEIGYFSPDANGVLQYTSLKNLIPKQYSKFTDIWEIEVYKESVFFRTWDRIFEYKDGAIQAYQAITGWQFMGLAGNKLIAQDKQKGLFEFINNGWQPLCNQNAIPNFEITGILPLNNDSLLISSLQNGLYIFHNGELNKKITGADNNFIKSHIYSFEQINSSEFAAGTTSEGCLIINTSGKIVQQIARTEGIQNNNVLCVFLDKDNNLWAGLDNGISYIGYNAAIKYIKPSKSNDLSGYSSRVFNNQLYIATSDGAYTAPLSMTDNKDLSFSKGEFLPIKNSSGQAWRLDEVNNQLFMGHHNGSFQIQNNEATQLTNETGTWLFVPTTSIFPAKNVLAGTYAGLTMFEFDNSKFLKSNELKGIYESFRFLAIDNNNDIWASHPYRGIYKIVLSADNNSYSTQLFTDKDGLPSTLRNNVFRIKNRVVFGTEKGIYEFDTASKKFIPSPLLFNVFGKMNIQYLNEDADGNIWFCSGKKIGVVNYTDGQKKISITYFPELTGKVLAGFENIYPYNKQNIFIASNNGVIHLNYEKYIAGKHDLSILLTQVNAFGKSDSLIFGGYFQQNSDAQLRQNKKSVLSFPISNNSFHFEFSSPAYSLHNTIEYSYQLEGYEEKWSAWTSKAEKDYTNLQNGSYTFNVKAHDNLGNESETISYSFVVSPPWYKTIWAYLSYAILFVALLTAITKWQKRKFLLQQAKFEEEQKRLKYVHQLEVEKNEKEIIQLQNERLSSEVIFKNKELADVSMRLIERNDALLKVKDELQQLYKKTGGNHNVKKAIELVNDIEKNNSNWEQFAVHFDEINNDFLKKLKTKYPTLTNTDLKICAYLQLKLSSKEIAQLVNISVRGVEISRYRLRKKLQLPTEKSLNDFLNEIHQK
jgi:ligand-binding sensor domain-containing protein/DNA-binding CsgD family transcriptional regulator